MNQVEDDSGCRECDSTVPKSPFCSRYCVICCDKKDGGLCCRKTIDLFLLADFFHFTKCIETKYELAVRLADECRVR